MDIHPSYSYLLGRPWIHEAGSVTSTLHQKLKFVKNKKLVVVEGEKALLVSHLSSFYYIDAEDEVGTPFQALSIVKPSKKVTSSFASYNDVKLAIKHGATSGLGQMIKLEDNKSRAGIGYSSGTFNKHGLFQSGGFIHTVENQEFDAVVEDDAEEDSGNFVIPGGAEEDDVEEIPDEIARLLEHEENIIQPHLENLETVNLGSEDCVREVNIGELLE
ncbi:hypothetical protein KIW84_055178 [Lathyrus oleraceus]|uniref:Uncharacterized protein n=1 Tax=Pisum sativum TaxID=3888 RepID=A0A9D4WXI0_PEA|nr:hypothetical protein KIW84_055178 [Pisum sativum]